LTFTSTEITKRIATTVALALVLFTAAFPGVAACCVEKPTANMAAMHASMPCCAPGCAISGPKVSRDSVVAVVSPPPVAAGPALINSIDPVVTTTVTLASERIADEFSSPPPFLAHAQFRI
jgi:hypothetical protein